MLSQTINMSIQTFESECFKLLKKLLPNSIFILFDQLLHFSVFKYNKFTASINRLNKFFNVKKVSLISRLNLFFGVIKLKIFIFATFI